MRHALSFSGGKDSVLALDRARRLGLDVVALFNIYDGNTGLVRFHGISKELIASQADALDLPLLQGATEPDTYPVVLSHLFDNLRTWDIDGIIFGNIHLEDIRSWYAERVAAHGFAQIEPLWGDSPTGLLREFIDRGYRARLTSVDLARTPRVWLGRQLDDDLLQDLEAHPEIDPCGERGEYHTFVTDGPLFRRSVEVSAGSPVNTEGHAILPLKHRRR